MRASETPQVRETVVTAAALTPLSLTAVDLQLQADDAFVVKDAVTLGWFVIQESTGPTTVSGALAEYLISDADQIE